MGISRSAAEAQRNAKENDPDPNKYLVFPFEPQPLINRADIQQVDSLLPWSNLVEANCKPPKKNYLLAAK